MTSPDAQARLTLVDRIKQIKAERKRYFDVEGDGVDVLLNDIWDYLDRTPDAQPSSSEVVTPEMVTAAMLDVPYNEYLTDEPYFAALAKHISAAIAAQVTKP